MLYSYDWQYPQQEKPADDQLSDPKWAVVNDMPEPLDWHTVGWEREKGWVQTPKPAQPFPSWVKNADNTDWEAPIPRPGYDQNYDWDELTLSWVAKKLINE